MVVINKEDSEVVRIEKRRENALHTPQRATLHRPPASPIEYEEEYDGVQSKHSWTGGEVRQVMYDGCGGRHYDSVFAGCTREEFMTRQREPQLGLSLGTNTLEIEGRLRQTKKKEQWREPERRGGVRPRAGRPSNL